MIKKLSTAIALSAFVLFGINCGGGSTDPLAGHIGHPCARTSFLGGSSCYDANSECHSGMCVSCGHTGEHCCNNSSRGCATGLTCEWDDSRSLDVCGGCGEVGERCCESRFSSTGTCNADAMCDPSSNECVTGPSGPCVGPEVFSIGVRDPNLCATEVRVVHSSSASDARSCVAMTLPPGYTTLELDKAELLQVALIVTDQHLEPVAEDGGLNLFVKLPPGHTPGPWVLENQPRIVEQSAEVGIPVTEVDRRLVNYVDDLLGSPNPEERYRPVLAGNSIHSDWTLVRRHLPGFARRINYRLLDVSSIKVAWRYALSDEYDFDKNAPEDLRRYFPAAKITERSTRHDAYYDAVASVAELSYYRSRLHVSESER